MSEGPNGNSVPTEVKDKFVIVISRDLKTNAINVSGQIDDIPNCYAALEMAKDAIRKWNEMNRGYLVPQPVPVPNDAPKG